MPQSHENTKYHQKEIKPIAKELDINLIGFENLLGFYPSQNIQEPYSRVFASSNQSSFEAIIPIFVH
jgi:hypothetical protein